MSNDSRITVPGRVVQGLVIGGVLVILILSGCHVTDWPLWGPDKKQGSCEVEKISGIHYGGPGPENRWGQLDIFLPKGKKDCPVVLFVHGGAWIMGDNRCCGLYSSVGGFLASQGIIAVLPNYRLSPEVKHPEHIKDVARAAAWIHSHIEECGGRRDQFFLMGHSAGGHLVSLLATDPQYLLAEGLSPNIIKGVISISGVYRIPPGSMDVTLGGQMPDSMRWDKMFPLRNPSSPSKVSLPGIPVTLDPFEPAFGTDAKIRADASPINHVRPGLPPFLLFYADNDLPSLPEMARDFHQTLLNQGCDVCLRAVPERNHNSIIFQAYKPNDVVAHTVVDFVLNPVSNSASRPCSPES
jgi:acetyl esterase/lipase